MSSNSLMLTQLIILLMAIIMATITNATNNYPISLNGCDDRCGNVSIQYPFGTQEGCYLSKQFYINCSTTSPPKAFLRESNIEVTEVSLPGQMRLLQYVTKQCYYSNGTEIQQGNSISYTSLGDYTMYNSSMNKLIAVGCDSYALIQGNYLDELYTTGCIASCKSMKQLMMMNGSCSGVGCCQLPIPRRIQNVTIGTGSLYNYSHVADDVDRCSFAFVAGENTSNFTPNIHIQLKENITLPSVADWFIGNTTCAKDQMNLTSYACKSNNSQCYEPDSYLSGYRCSCKDGFEGNPYLEGGCKDINECEPPYPHNCKANSQCNNTYGNYTCTCLDGFHGDGREGCIPNPVHDRNEVNKLLAGGAIGAIVLLVAGGSLYIAFQKRKLAMKKMRFFKDNGGVMLLEQLIQQGKSTTAVRIFTSEELKQATNNYDEKGIVGQGGYGIVYKGYFPDNDVVAIKKSKMVDRTQIEEFINETRLRIAMETAEVLSYLHSAASIPIIHRDVKSTNILLDNSYTAKVSDFGASRLVPLDETSFSTLVRGTFGYLDPEYMQTSQLTDRSDVYSFGVVLAELLTGEKAVSFDRSKEDRSLANHFLSSIKEHRLLDVLDCHILSDGNMEHLKGVAMLAKRCLNVKGEDRPTMKEVATKLQGFQIILSDQSSEVDYCQVVNHLTSYESGNDSIISVDCDNDEQKMLPSKKK